MANGTRPIIPEHIKRQLRQEAGYGCCKCGNPIFQYHHIDPDSAVAEDMMILCPNHHFEATVRAMDEQEQRSYKAEPVNLQKGYAEGILKTNQTDPAIRAGGIEFVGDGDFIVVDNDNLLSLTLATSGRIEVSVQLYDRTDNLIALIERNEWISGDPLPWDLESSFNRLLIRKKLRDITLEIDARTFPIEIRADLWCRGQNFRLDPREIRFNGVQKGIGLMDLCFVGIRLIADTSAGEFRLEPDRQFGEGAMISEPDPQRRIDRALEVWSNMNNPVD